MNSINVQIQHRSDTSANWIIKNPILLNQELGFESDTGRFKIGKDGVSWNNLPYANNDAPKILNAKLEPQGVYPNYKTWAGILYSKLSNVNFENLVFAQEVCESLSVKLKDVSDSSSIEQYMLALYSTILMYYFGSEGQDLNYVKRRRTDEANMYYYFTQLRTNLSYQDESFQNLIALFQDLYRHDNFSDRIWDDISIQISDIISQPDGATLLANFFNEIIDLFQSGEDKVIHTEVIEVYNNLKQHLSDDDRVDYIKSIVNIRQETKQAEKYLYMASLLQTRVDFTLNRGITQFRIQRIGTDVYDNITQNLGVEKFDVLQHSCIYPSYESIQTILESADTSTIRYNNLINQAIHQGDKIVIDIPNIYSVLNAEREFLVGAAELAIYKTTSNTYDIDDLVSSVSIDKLYHTYTATFNTGQTGYFFIEIPNSIKDSIKVLVNGFPGGYITHTNGDGITCLRTANKLNQISIALYWELP